MSFTQQTNEFRERYPSFGVGITADDARLCGEAAETDVVEPIGEEARIPCEL